MSKSILMKLMILDDIKNPEEIKNMVEQLLSDIESLDDSDDSEKIENRFLRILDKITVDSELLDAIDVNTLQDWFLRLQKLSKRNKKTKESGNHDLERELNILRYLRDTLKIYKGQFLDGDFSSYEAELLCNSFSSVYYFLKWLYSPNDRLYDLITEIIRSYTDFLGCLFEKTSAKQRWLFTINSLDNPDRHLLSPIVKAVKELYEIKVKNLTEETE
jgi:hypothetical protein